MTDVPAAIVSALTQRRNAGMPDAHGWVPTSHVSEGDLRVVEPLSHRPADHRIGLVLRVESSNEFTEALLVHSAAELATDRDVVIPAGVAAAPYDAVVQTDLRAVVWSFQLGKRIGHLDQQSLAAVRAIGNRARAGMRVETPASTVQEFSSGTRLDGPLDPRWPFKESEGVALRRLAADCTEALRDPP